MMTAPPVETCTAGVSRIGGRTLVTFGGCNYLGLAQDPRVLEAARMSLARVGLSASASRETTGNRVEHETLERTLPAFCGLGHGLLVPDGYIANLTALQALASLGVRHAVIDARAHASLHDAARMGGMNARPFRHLDGHDAARTLAACSGPAAVLTDTVFAADGDRAPARALLGMLRDDDWLVLDDCHGLGVLGAQGRGTAAALGLEHPRLIVTSTLAKGIGCGGGVVLGDTDLIHAARTRSTAYICTTPASPALAAAALEAIRILETDPQPLASLRENMARMQTELDAPDDHGVPIFAFTVGDESAMRALHAEAWERGVWLPLVAYPGGPAPVYMRMSVSAAHTPEQIALAGSIVRSHRLTQGARP